VAIESFQMDSLLSLKPPGGERGHQDGTERNKSFMLKRYSLVWESQLSPRLIQS